MKIAILISGFLRTIEHNLEKNLQLFEENNTTTNEKIQFDYYLHISNEEHLDEYFNKHTSIKNVIDKLNPIHIIYENEIKSTEIDQQYINMYRMWYKIYLLNTLKNTHAKANKFRYDLVIRMRPDLYIIDKTIDLKTIIHNSNKSTTNFEKNNSCIYSLNDEFFMGNSTDMDLMCNLFLEFELLIKIIKSNRKYYDNFKKTIFFQLYTNKHKIKILEHNIYYKLILSLCNIIAISGDSGTGKTTLMKHINSLFKIDPLQIEGDRYHKWERGNENWNKFTHLDPEANHISKFKDDVFNLKIGNDIYQVDYDHSNGKFTDVQELKNKNDIVLCGLHTLFDKETNKLYNLKIFLDPDEKLRYHWKIKRDVEHRGYTCEKVLEAIKKRLTDGQKYIKPQSFESDIIISFFTDNTFDYTDLSTTNKPNIYLNLKIKNTIFIDEFIKLLSIYDIKTKIIINTYKNEQNQQYEDKKNNYVQIILHEISNKFQDLYLYLLMKNNDDISKKKEEIDYYTIIKALFIYLKY